MSKENYQTPDNVKWVNLVHNSIKILPIYFTYNKKIHQQENFDRILLNLQSVLNIWKGRPLTVYGKTTVIKTLALPKVLYVTSLLDTPRDFVKKVKSLVLDFLWSGRKPKVKYSAIIGDKLRGGLEFPDIQSKIEAQHIMCIKRLIDDNQNKLRPWKEIPLNYSKPLGGAYGISNNFNVKMVPNKIPPFYKNLFTGLGKSL